MPQPAPKRPFLPLAARRGAAVAALAALSYPICLAVCEALARWLLSAAGGLPGAGPQAPAGVAEAPALLLWAAASALALLLPGSLAAHALRLSPRRLGLARPRGGPPARWFAPLFLGTAALASTLGGMLGRALGIPAQQTLLPAGGRALAAAFLSLCLLPAVMEELFFRGVLQTALRPFGSGAAVLGSALLFALCHGSPSQALSALVSGLLLGLFAEWRGSIWPGAALHLANNMLAFCCSWLAQYADGELAAVLGFGAGLAFLAGGLAAALSAQKKGRQTLPRKRGVPALPKGQGHGDAPGRRAGLHPFCEGLGIRALFGCPAWLLALAGLGGWMFWRWVF